MKTVVQYLVKNLPNEVLTKAIKNSTIKELNTPISEVNALIQAFVWSDTKEGENFWKHVNQNYFENKATTTTNKTMSIERHEELTQQLKSIFEEFTKNEISCVIAYERSNEIGSSLLCSGKPSYLHMIIANMFKGILANK
jgi:hypothetical protein